MRSETPAAHDTGSVTSRATTPVCIGKVQPPVAVAPRARLDAMNDDREEPSFLAMIGLVALIVAVVILVFFGIGYLFGRAFL